MSQYLSAILCVPIHSLKQPPDTYGKRESRKVSALHCVQQLYDVNVHLLPLL